MNSVVPQLLALLQACKEDPVNDEPRLVLADWLMDQTRSVVLGRLAHRLQ